jgi:hypothetical protein
VPYSRLDLFPEKGLVGHYRKIFSSPEGKEVLVHMLCDLGLFIETEDSAEEQALSNYAKRILRILSGGEPSKEAIQNFSMQLMRQDLPKETEE